MSFIYVPFERHDINRQQEWICGMASVNNLLLVVLSIMNNDNSIFSIYNEH